MKTFRQFLLENIRKYEFRLYFSGKPAADAADQVRKLLGAFQVTDTGKMRTEPVRKQHQMFPLQQSPEVYVLDVTCAYPANSEQIRQSLLPAFAADQLAVQNLQQAEDQALQLKQQLDKPQQPLLTTEPEPSTVKTSDWFGTEYNQQLVNKSRTGIALKPLAGAAPVSKPAATTNDLPVGTLSPVGSKPVQMPSRFQRKD